jgi:type IV secretory pathway VirB4 component
MLGATLERLALRRPAHIATTSNTQAIYPFQADVGLGNRGVYIGTDNYHSSFVYDPWELYQRALTSPNMMVIGEVGKGKSALLKTYCYRQSVFGRRIYIVDPKGEYGPLARALGEEPIKVEPGGDVILNPIHPGSGPAGQLALLKAVSSCTLGRELTPTEAEAIRVALETIGAREPIVSDVVERLLRPTADMASHLAMDVATLAEGARDVALALQAMSKGELAGMFDGHSTVSIADKQIVVLDLSSVYHSKALGVLMTCAHSWIQAEIDARTRAAERGGGMPAKNINIYDECWRILPLPGIGDWLQDRFKHSRRYGLQNIVAFHKLTDLTASGDVGSRVSQVADGLLGDTGTIVSYRQPPDQLEELRNRVGYTNKETAEVQRLPIGVALWKVEGKGYIVRHRLSEIERELIDTDSQMKTGSAEDASKSG